MNYQKIYDDFIIDRRIKELTISGYTEKHHIIPRSLGGDNSKENLIRLSAQDHYFAHELLAQIHGGGMSRALWMMTTSKKYKASRSRYESIRIKQSNFAKGLAKKYLIGRKKTDAEVNKISESLKKYYTNNPKKVGAKLNLSTDQRLAISRRFKDYYSKNIHPLKGKPMSESHREKLRAYMLSDKCHRRGVKLSDEHKLKIGMAQIGVENHAYKSQIYRFSKYGMDDFIGTQNDFYKKFNLHKSGASKLCNGINKTHKGWTVEKLDA